jgi:hypothetical protein
LSVNQVDPRASSFRNRARLSPYLVYTVGEKVTRTVTKRAPKMITNNGHQRSTQDTDSCDELISIFSFFYFTILTENQSCAQFALVDLCWFCCFNFECERTGDVRNEVSGPCGSFLSGYVVN